MATETNRYVRAIAEEMQEFKKLMDQKKAIDTRIANITELIIANIKMIPDENERKTFMEAFHVVQEPSGLSEAVVRVLRFDTAMSAVEVRDALIKSGYDLSSHSNALASVHTTLRRLADSGRIVKRDDGERTLYRRSYKVTPPPGVKPK
jgi:hypothetical protein